MKDKWISVLIADDEVIEREGIKMLLELSSYEFQIHMAENGEEALEWLSCSETDLVFTDIKMPFLDGLSLLEEVRKTNAGLKVIMVTAFAEFDYARRALEHHANHYLLKPIDPDEFEKLLDEVVQSIWEEREMAEEVWLTEAETACRSYLKTGDTRYLPVMAGVFERFAPCTGQIYDLQEESTLALSKFYQEARNREEVLILNMRDGVYLLLVSIRSALQRQRRIKTLLEECGIMNGFVIVSKEPADVHTLPAIVMKMDEMLEFHFFEEGNKIYQADEQIANAGDGSNDIEEILSKIKSGIDTKNLWYVSENLNLLYGVLCGNKNNSRVYTKYLYGNIIQWLHEGSQNSDGAGFEDILEKVFKENTLHHMHEHIQNYIAAMDQQDTVSQDHLTDQKKVIKTVLDIIEARYREDINLQSIAREVYLSPSYLSHLFKKHMKQTLIKYITSVRMARAKELLSQTNMRTSDIAQEVGFNNYSYFNTTFRNHVGESPAQYREKN